MSDCQVLSGNWRTEDGTATATAEDESGAWLVFPGNVPGNFELTADVHFPPDAEDAYAGLVFGFPRPNVGFTQGANWAGINYPVGLLGVDGNRFEGSRNIPVKVEADTGIAVQVFGSTARVLLGGKPVIRRDMEDEDFELEEKLVGLLIEHNPGETDTATLHDVRVRRLTAPPDDLGGVHGPKRHRLWRTSRAGGRMNPSVPG